LDKACPELIEGIACPGAIRPAVWARDCEIKDRKKGFITCKGPLKYKRVATEFAKKKNLVPL